MDVAPFLGLRARLALGCTLGRGCATPPAAPAPRALIGPAWYSCRRGAIYIFCNIFPPRATRFFSCSGPDAAADAGLRPGRPVCNDQVLLWDAPLIPGPFIWFCAGPCLLGSADSPSAASRCFFCAPQCSQGDDSRFVNYAKSIP